MKIDSSECGVGGEDTFLENLGEATVDMMAYSSLGIAFLLIRDLHYGRNVFNNTCSENELIEMGYMPEKPEDAKFHQNNQIHKKENRKYVIGEWFSSEMVFYDDGTVNDTPEDTGTFNVYSGDNPFLNFVVHGICDVLPYMIWGNSADDSSSIIDRFEMIFQ